MEQYTTEQAAQKAIEWCEKNKGWQRICDLTFDSEELYYQWEEMSDKERKAWIEHYGIHSAKDAWLEFGKKKCKVPYGFVTGKGEFYKDVLEVPRFHNLMMVFKVN